MAIMMSMFGTGLPTLLSFPQERPVFLREYSTDHYSVFSYFTSRLAMEAFITALQILVQAVITYFLISFRSTFWIYYLNLYALAMASTALAVLVGCSVEDPKLAPEMLPILFVPQMLFSGFFVVPELIPVWLRWARYLCSLTFAVRIGLKAEFGNGCGSVEGDDACERLLENIDVYEMDEFVYWLILVALFFVFRVIALYVLQQKAVKFF
jgi:ABC-2 type transporter